jgi:DNA-binding response OmpR family regulator
MMCKRQGRREQVRVLIADWDQDSAFALSAIMLRAGFKVATSCDGMETVHEAALFRPDLLVAEPYLGRLSGVDAAVRITAAFPACNVLFLSSEASIADIERMAPAELVYSYTAKPIRPLDLLNAIAYIVCAEWSSEPNEPAMPGEGPGKRAAGGKSRAAENQSLSGGPTSLRDDVLQPHYFSAPLDEKRQRAERHIKSRRHRIPACV